MPDPHSSERLAEIEARASEFYVVGDAWPNREKKKLIGEDISWLLEQIREAREQSEQWRQGMIEQSARRHVAEKENARLREALRQIAMGEPSAD